MMLALDPEFVTGREIPDCSLETLLDVVFPALHWFCKADRIYFRMDDKWYEWTPEKK